MNLLKCLKRERTQFNELSRVKVSDLKRTSLELHQLEIRLLNAIRVGDKTSQSELRKELHVMRKRARDSARYIALKRRAQRTS